MGNPLAIYFFCLSVSLILCVPILTKYSYYDLESNKLYAKQVVLLVNVVGKIVVSARGSATA